MAAERSQFIFSLSFLHEDVDLMKNYPDKPLGSSLSTERRGEKNRIQATVCGAEVSDGEKTSSDLLRIHK